jgi:Prp8 binding protein
MNQIAIHQPHLLDKGTPVTTLAHFEQIEEEKPNRVLSSPNLQLIGHKGEVYCVKFSPNGELLATAGLDKKIFLWGVYDDCKNIGILGECHNAILELQWSTDGTRMYSASADKTVGIWDMEVYKSIKNLRGHTSYVNTCHPTRRGTELLVSGGDDGKTKVWDLRTKKFAMEFEG